MNSSEVFKSISKKCYEGFTLIELLVVITVMGVLAAIVLIAVNPLAQFNKAQDAQRVSNVRAIVNAFEEYYVFKSSYPDINTTQCIGVPTSSTCWGDRNIPGSTSLMDTLAPYLKTFPKDPEPTRGWGDAYLYLDGTTPNGCNATSNPGQYILWRPEKQPASDADCQSMGFMSCCGTSAPCGNDGGFYCAYKLNQ